MPDPTLKFVSRGKRDKGRDVTQLVSKRQTSAPKDTFRLCLAELLLYSAINAEDISTTVTVRLVLIVNLNSA